MNSEKIKAMSNKQTPAKNESDSKKNTVEETSAL